jgi:xanthine dehydrogenase iron-sulfur cluster and FAD-binding subunit A
MISCWEANFPHRLSESLMAISFTAALLAKKPNPTDADIEEPMAGNICRCGTYQRIDEAIHRAAGHRTTTARSAVAARTLARCSVSRILA